MLLPHAYSPKERHTGKPRIRYRTTPERWRMDNHSVTRGRTGTSNYPQRAGRQTYPGLHIATAACPHLLFLTVKINGLVGAVQQVVKERITTNPYYTPVKLLCQVIVYGLLI